MIDHNALVTAMMCYSEQQFIRALRKDPERRSMQVSKSNLILNLHNISNTYNLELL